MKTHVEDKCRLLFVGREWERKGGEIAFETLLALERLGVPTELTIVGCEPPERFRHPNLRVIAFLNQNNAAERAELENLYLKSHFFLLPTRAECFSIALCEANAYGLPILSSQTGGLGELVHEGTNGFLLPLDARGGAIAAKIHGIYNLPAAYASLRESSRDSFECRLNWDSWGRKMEKVLRRAVGEGATPMGKSQPGKLGGQDTEMEDAGALNFSMQ